MSTELQQIHPDASQQAAFPINGDANPGGEPQELLISRPLDPDLFPGGFGGGGFVPAPDPGLILPPPPVSLGPVINSVQPSQVPVGFTAVVVLTGARLPVNAASYTVINAQGFASGVQVAGASGSSSQVSLTLSVPASTPPGSYRIRVQANGFASEISLAIVGTVGIRIDSVQPGRIPQGATSTVTARGVSLPAGTGSYSVVGNNGFPLPGVQVLSASGSSSQVSVQISVAANAPLGTAFLRASVTGSAAQFPLEIFQGQGIVIFSVQPSQLFNNQRNLVTLSGSNLPTAATAYSVQGPFGSIGATISVLFVTIDAVTGLATSVALSILLPQFTQPGFYRIRAQSGTQGAEIPVQVF
ncbi:MAG: hypothetical protein ACJ76Y_27640 [Thermoanaerobaculia bacterium]